MTRTLMSCWTFLTAIQLVAVNVAAQDIEAQLIPEISDNIVDYERAGWHPRLKFNGTFSLGQSANVPGNTDGVSLQVGSLLHATADYLSRNQFHEWTNALIFNLGYSRTPVVDVWIKSMDSLEFKTAYLYHFPRINWVGSFFSFRVNTALLPAEEVQSEPVLFVRLHSGDQVSADVNGLPVDENGTPLPYGRRSAGSRIGLTDAFAPLTLRETLGLFAKPISETPFNLDTRLGIGAWETFTRGGYYLDDNDDTPFLELRKLQDSRQVGVELGIVANGMLHNDLLTYMVSALFMHPFYHSPDTEELKGIELMNMEFEASLGVKVSEYLSINYSFKALKQPLVIDDFQIQNNLLISIGFDLVGNPPPKQSGDECDCADAVNAAREKWQAENVAVDTATAEPDDFPSTPSPATQDDSE
jgi:hypothetical protein